MEVIALKVFSGDFLKIDNFLKKQYDLFHCKKCFLLELPTYYVLKEVRGFCDYRVYNTLQHRGYLNYIFFHYCIHEVTLNDSPAKFMWFRPTEYERLYAVQYILRSSNNALTSSRQ